MVLDEPPGAGVATGRRRRTGPDDDTAAVLNAALSSELDEVVVVVGDERRAASLPEGVTVLLDRAIDPTSRLRSALDWCARSGHDAIVVRFPATAGAPAPAAELDPAAWSALVHGAATPIAVLCSASGRTRLVRLDAEAWPLVPLEGSLVNTLSVQGSLVTEVAMAAAARPLAGAGAHGLETAEPSVEDVAAVGELLGRSPSGPFEVVVRNRHGKPVVIRNGPFLFDGTPMPTRYWLVGRSEREAVGRLESSGGVRAATSHVDPDELAAAHARYGAERDRAIPAGHRGPRPTGGVGGTRTGVKCLHAHLAWYLAGGHDPVGRWVVDELAGLLSGPVGAIDCGTNSTRLLIADASGVTLERRMTITRLGEGVDTTGSLARAAIDRTIRALLEYRDLLDDHGVVAVRAAATSAARDADNAEEFFTAAEGVLGVRPQLLSGEEEGRLSYAGATAGLDQSSGPYLVVDLGGGSTELVAPGASAGEISVISLDVGCVRVTERFLKSDPPTAGELDAARDFVGAEIDRALATLPALSTPKHMIGVAGTVSTLVSLALGLDHYDPQLLHHATMDRATVDRLAAELAAEPAARRAERKGIEAGRADVIAAGALVLSETMAHSGHETLVYSESDILDGLAADLLARQR